MNWQPIETAPKNGEMFLAYYEGNGFGPKVGPMQWLKNAGAKGRFHSWAALTETTNATHWMPLPPPPTEQTSDSNRPHPEIGAGRSAKRE